jgi:tRNA (adenine37-N6)-methyltransferase
VTPQLPCPLPVIGHVRTPYAATEDTPVQSALNPGVTGVLELDPAYAAGLSGLDGFTHAWLLCWLDRSGRAAGEVPALTQVPFLLRPQGKEMGIFATRGPRRVNPIGLSLVRLVRIEANRVEFAGVDLLDGTPVLDLKPYVTRFDRPDGEPRCGWFDDVPMPDGVTPARLNRPVAGPDEPGPAT